MEKILVLDESGVIDSSISVERYFVLGGILYDKDQVKYLRTNYIPILDRYREALKSVELKSSEFKSSKKDKSLYYGAILSLINCIKEITPIIYIMDKKAQYIFDYYPRKSHKYNKMIEYLIQDLIKDKVIQSTDKIDIVLDEISLSKVEIGNLKGWLVDNVEQVSSVSMSKSDKVNSIQMADILAGVPNRKNSNSSLLSKKDPRMIILSRCYVHMFPKSSMKSSIDY